jgi:hypothetical protein
LGYVIKREWVNDCGGHTHAMALLRTGGVSFLEGVFLIFMIARIDYPKIERSNVVEN